MADLKYLRDYPEPLLAQVRQLIAEQRLGDYLQRRYPGRHEAIFQAERAWTKRSSPRSGEAHEYRPRRASAGE